MKRFYFSYAGKGTVSPGVWKTASEVVKEAGKDLKLEDHLDRRFAVAALHQLGEHASSQVDALGLATGDEDPGVRYWATATVANLGTKFGYDVIDQHEKLAERLKDSDCGVRCYAAIAIAFIGSVQSESVLPYSDDLMGLLEDSDPQVRIEATKALAEILEDDGLEEIATILMKSLKKKKDKKKEEPIFKASSAEALGYVGAAGLPFVKDLKRAMKDDYAMVRKAAAQAIGCLGIEAMKEGCVDISKLADSDPDAAVRAAAERSLAQMDLAEALDHSDKIFRAWAVARLAGKGPKATKPLLDKLGELLSDKYSKVRERAAYALGDLGHASDEFVPKLLKIALNDKDPETRVTALKAAVKIDQNGAKAIAPDIPKSLKHEKVAVRKSAVQCLSALGIDAIAQAVDINEALLDEDIDVRIEAAKCIKNMGKPACRVAGANLGDRALNDEDATVRRMCASVLYEFYLATKFGLPRDKPKGVP